MGKIIQGNFGKKEVVEVKAIPIKSIPMKRIDVNYREELLKAVKNDKALIAKISKMTDEQVTKAFENTQGSLLAFVDRMEQCDRGLAEFIRDDSIKNDDTVMVMAAINFVVRFCEEMPQLDHADPINSAHEKLFVAESTRVVDKAIRGV